MPARTEEKMLSVAEVFEMTPGDEQNATWINPGFTAVVSDIKATQVKSTGRTMNICTLQDQTGSAKISMTVFSAVKFSKGDVIEVRGAGLRRTEYNGLAQVSMGKATEIHVLGKSVHHEEQAKRAETLEPAVNGTKQPVHGATVGMAMKEAITLALRPDQFNSVPLVTTPEFWKRVHEHASAIIRLSNALEHGNLTPSLTPPKPAAAAPVAEAPPPAGGRADPPKGTNRKPPAGENGEAFPRRGGDAQDEDVPF